MINQRSQISDRSRSKSKGRSYSGEPLPRLGYQKAQESHAINFTITDKGARKKKEFQMTRFTELKLPEKIIKGVGKTFSRDQVRKQSGELDKS